MCSIFFHKKSYNYFTPTRLILPEKVQKRGFYTCHALKSVLK